METSWDYIVYTDGAYSQQHSEGAFAYIMLDGNHNEVKRLSRKIWNETNNRAELKAIIAALYHLPEDAKNVCVVSDSQYALNTLFGTWCRRANHDLFDIADKIMNERGFHIVPSWVKGHSGNVYNEQCDRMCTEVLGYDPSKEYAKYAK